MNAESRREALLPVSGSKARALLIWGTLAALGLQCLPRPFDMVLWPVRIFVTFIHESGHALTTVISGGGVEYMQIRPDGSGVTLSMQQPWASWLIISGGYLGAATFGAMLLQLVRYRGHKLTLNLIGAYMLAITLMWAHSPIDLAFTLPVGLLLAALFFVAAYKLNAQAAGVLVAFLAIQCCLNSIADLRTLLYLTTQMPGTDNDAVFMSRHYPLPPTFWAVLWALCAAAILTFSLWRYFRATAGRGAGAPAIAR